MRWTVLVFIPVALAGLVPRCDDHSDATGASIETASTSTAAPTALAATTTSSGERKAKTTTAKAKAVKKASTTCKPMSICADYIDACGHRYGGCYDSKFCDGNTSPYPVPTCVTTIPAKRHVADQATPV